jgi:hypothetical protein
MIWILREGPLVLSLAQNLANVPETTKSRSPACRDILFRELIFNARGLSRSYFAGALFDRAHDVAGRCRIGIQREAA